MERSSRKRSGKLSWPIAVLSAAGVVGTAVMVPQMTSSSKSPSNTSPSSATVSQETASPAPAPISQAIESQGDRRGATANSSKPIAPGSGIIASGSSQKSLIDRVSPKKISPPKSSTPKPGPSNSVETEEEPASIDEIVERSISDGALAQADSDPEQVGEQVPAGGSAPEGLASISDKPYDTVDVFYATDRDLIDPNSMLHWARIFLPAVLGCIVSGLMILAYVRSKERVIWGIGLGCSVVFTLMFGYHAWIYGQESLRLIKSSKLAYGTRRYESSTDYPLHLGLSQVTIPKDHQKGTIERPSIFKAEIFEDPRKHVILQRVEEQEADIFFQGLKSAVDASGESSAFIFIHGYNVEFSDALLRTAQISKDLSFKGAPILYSWPSHGTLLGYTKDESNVSWSVVHLTQFLRDVKERTGVKNLHIVAHSMGNRALVGALEQIALSDPTHQPSLGQVVMAAPDVDGEEFRSRYAKSVALCSRQATLYTSGTDRALLASMKIHGYPRLGLSSGKLPSFNDIDTVEISPIDPSLLGHSYYGSHPLLLQDLSAIVELGEPPAKRRWLTRVVSENRGSTWRFEPRLANQVDYRVKR